MMLPDGLDEEVARKIGRARTIEQLREVYDADAAAFVADTLLADPEDADEDAMVN